MTERASSRWFAAALAMPALGLFLCVMEASEVEARRLRHPVPAVGEFVKAECVTRIRRGRVRSEAMHITYQFDPGQDGPTGKGAAAGPASPTFTALGSVVFPARADCEAALPATRVAKEPHPIWFERERPHEATTTLDEPNSLRLLLVGLVGIPMAMIGWLLRRRRGRSRQVSRDRRV